MSLLSKVKAMLSAWLQEAPKELDSRQEERRSAPVASASTTLGSGLFTFALDRL